MPQPNQVLLFLLMSSGQMIGSLAPALDSASTQTARLVHRMADHNRIVVHRDLRCSLVQCAQSLDHSRLCCCNHATNITSINCKDSTTNINNENTTKVSENGPIPGPQLRNVSLVDVVAGVDPGNTTLRILLFHFSGAINTTESISFNLEICGLPFRTKTSTNKNPRHQIMPATVWVINQNRSSFWSAWQQDLKQYAGSQPWPKGSSPYDETAPAAVRERPGYEWVAEEWSKSV